MICPAQLSDLHHHHLPFVHYGSAMLSSRVFPEAVLETRIWVHIDKVREDPREHGEGVATGHINEGIASVNYWAQLCWELSVWTCLTVIPAQSEERGELIQHVPSLTGEHCSGDRTSQCCQVPIQGGRTLLGRHGKP